MKVEDADKEIASHVVKVLKTERQRAGISQVDMAKLMGVARQTLIDMELGLRSPRLSLLVSFSSITGTPLYKFIPGYLESPEDLMTLNINTVNKVIEKSEELKSLLNNL